MLKSGCPDPKNLSSLFIEFQEFFLGRLNGFRSTDEIAVVVYALLLDFVVPLMPDALV
jgi:hypothetical protein